jgi:hypothetical protein
LLFWRNAFSSICVEKVAATLPIFRIPPRSAIAMALVLSSKLTTKNSLENEHVSNFTSRASRNEMSSARDNFQFFPGINTRAVGVVLGILAHAKTSIEYINA